VAARIGPWIEAPPARRRRLPAILAALGLLLAAPVLPLRGQSSGGPIAESRARQKEPEKQLTELARALRDDESAAAYARLSEFASRQGTSALGARAALALGYYDFGKGRQPQAQRWLERSLARAPRDWVLREYALYWRAQARRALGNEAEALAVLETFRREFPASVMADQALQSLAEAALALGKPDRAVAALDAYDKVESKPALLLLRAQAREQTGQTKAAASDYLAVYYRFPLSDDARIAGEKIPALESSLGEEFPGVPVEQQVSRAEALFDAHRWRPARSEYESLLPKVSDQRYQRATLRIAQCRAQLGAAPGPLASLALTDPELDAERLYSISQFFRAHKQEAEMLAGIEQLAARFPQSRWTDEGLFAAGNYFWVNLDKNRATAFYRRVWEQFPAGKNALTAHWRLAWVAYLERRGDAPALLEEHLRKYPGSPYTQDALYWLGRAAERAGNVPHARSFYLKAQERFPQTYFGRRAAERLRALGAAPVNGADFLALVPSPPPLPQLDERVPPTAEDRRARAQALRTIAFDASAELELRAAYAATGVPRLLWEAAQAALDARRYTVAVSLARQVYPQLETRRMDEVPLAVWRTVFPLPFEQSLKRAAARANVDPMLVAAVIRQESVFQPDAVSRAGAVGLMQVLPKTGRKLAGRLKMRYAHASLFNPEYNLRLGTLYLADLVNAMASPEAALAAFNAGEERVAAWQAEHNFDEPAEFVESIPFTETRDYVQIVMRNAQLYRLLY
jgi:soluble lytic murein transglycosylase